MIANVVSQAHCSAVALRAPRGPKSGPRCSRDSACGLIPMLFANGSHASQIYPTTPPPGQGLLRFAKSTPARSPTDPPSWRQLCRNHRLSLPWRANEDGSSRWIGLDSNTRVLGPSFIPLAHHYPLPPSQRSCTHLISRWENSPISRAISPIIPGDCKPQVALLAPSGCLLQPFDARRSRTKRSSTRLARLAETLILEAGGYEQ